MHFQGLQSHQSSFCQISQDTLRKWEKAAKETSYICNQSADFNRCITKILYNVQEQLKILQSELGKGKSSSKAQTALDEAHYLTTFNQNVSFAMGKALQHLSDFTFIQKANLILLTRNSYLEHLKQGVKPDTFSALRNCPLNGHALFPDAVIRKAEDEIAQYETSKRTPDRAMGGSPVGTRNCNKIGTSHIQPGGKMKILPSQLVRSERICRPGKVLEVAADPVVEAQGVKLVAVLKPPKTTHSINDNYCVVDPVPVARSLNVVAPVKDKNICHCSSECILSCCQSCTFCNKCHKAVAKERCKSSIKSQKKNKFCEKCFYCRSLHFCPTVPNVPNVAHF